MTHHFPEKQINQFAERYIFQKTEPPADFINHCKLCIHCLQQYDFFRDFYRNFQEELQQEPDPRLTRLFNQFLSAHVIPLYRFQPQPDYNSIGIGDRTLVLAAQGMKTDRQTYSDLATFAFPPKKTILRVVKDQKENRDLLYVLAEKEDFGKHVLIGISEGEKSYLLGTDSKGIASLSRPQAVNWNQAAVLLLIPMAIFKITKNFNIGTRNRVTLSIQRTDPSFVFRVQDPYGKKIKNGMAVYKNGSIVVHSLDKDMIMFPNQEGNQLIEVRLFN